jgi:hypothetical protein
VGKKAGKPKAKREEKGSKWCPDDYRPGPELFAWAAKEHPDVDAKAEWEYMRNFEFPKPRTNWDKVFRCWIMNAVKFKKERSVSSGYRGRELPAQPRSPIYDEYPMPKPEPRPPMTQEELEAHDRTEASLWKPKAMTEEEAEEEYRKAREVWNPIGKSGLDAILRDAGL